VNSVHDMGGMDGFGPIVREKDEPVFHADWEGRVFALVSAVPFVVPFDDDLFRQAIERTPPTAYLHSSYYALWLRALESLLKERGLPEAGNTPTPPLAADAVAAAVAAGASSRQPEEAILARFAVGDAVIARNINPTGHTRLPRYARGKRGIVLKCHGGFRFPDSNASGDGPAPQHVYTVAFTAAALWGHEGRTGQDKICLDLWDAYLDLDPAQA